MSTQATVMLEMLKQAGVSPQGLSADSRAVQPGDVFVAYPGYRTDGRRFVGDAIARGAAAVLYEADGDFQPEAASVPQFAVHGLRDLSGYLAHVIHGRPSETLWLAGVTGTNGKTTVSQWIARALSDLGEPCAVIGTLGNGFPGALEQGANTTPDAAALHRLLADYLARGARATVMEVSSIGLDQGRVNGAAFDAAVFTNLSRDHLDYHGNMEEYGASKARLFDLPGISAHVINLDDAFGLTQARRLAEAGKCVIGYTLIPSNADILPGAQVVMTEELRMLSSGMRCKIRCGAERAEVNLQLVARFNASNLLAVLGALLARGIRFEEAVRTVVRLQAPEGRMQVVGGVCEPLAIIDYAHTPDALAKVLEAARLSAEARSGDLICVFGCGGDRDPGKRPMMGEVATQLADRVVLTSDNPRSEDPAAILTQIAVGAGRDAEIVADRALAIRRAIGEAGANDVIVIAGKGHENYQEIRGERLPFLDLSEAKKALEAWHAAQGDAP